MRVRQERSLLGEKLLWEMSEHFRRLVIEELAIPFAAVATDLETGREITAQTGPLARAVTASGAFPLLFPPVKIVAAGGSAGLSGLRAGGDNSVGCQMRAAADYLRHKCGGR